MIEKKFFLKKFNGSLKYRYFKSEISSRRTVICLPGGPGISNNYMLPFVKAISQHLKVNCILVEFPNHGARLNFKSYFNYKDLVNIIHQFVISFPEKTSLLGHSFGAQLALDVIQKKPKNISSLIMLNYPLVDRLKSKIDKKIKHIDIATELDFRNYWTKILPFYFYKYEPKFSNVLTKKTTWIRNRHLTTRNNILNKAALVETDSMEKILIHTDKDIFAGVTESKKFSKKTNSKNYLIEKTGHFPMMENLKMLISLLKMIID